jgi:hypothetical protein
MFYLDIAKLDLVLHTLQCLYMYVASVCFKYFSCFKHMLQVFYLYDAYVAVAKHVLPLSVNRRRNSSDTKTNKQFHLSVFRGQNFECRACVHVGLAKLIHFSTPARENMHAL